MRTCSRQLTLVLATFFAAAVLVGCQSSSAPVASGRSVTAGKTTFVEVPTGQGQARVIAYTENNAEACPECSKVAEKYFSTGVLDETVCKTCGAKITTGQGRPIQPQ